MPETLTQLGRVFSMDIFIEGDHADGEWSPSTSAPYRPGDLGTPAGGPVAATALQWLDAPGQIDRVPTARIAGWASRPWPDGRTQRPPARIMERTSDQPKPTVSPSTDIEPGSTRTKKG